MINIIDGMSNKDFIDAVASNFEELDLLSKNKIINGKKEFFVDGFVEKARIQTGKTVALSKSVVDSFTTKSGAITTDRGMLAVFGFTDTTDKIIFIDKIFINSPKITKMSITATSQGDPTTVKAFKINVINGSRELISSVQVPVGDTLSETVIFDSKDISGAAYYDIEISGKKSSTLNSFLVADKISVWGD